jgi:hypothetical protein
MATEEIRDGYDGIARPCRGGYWTFLTAAIEPCIVGDNLWTSKGKGK